MRIWSRRNALGGVRFKSQMDAREASVLRSLVESVAGLLEQRADSAPTDDLAELTGIRSGNTTSPSDPTLARLLPDFHKPEPSDQLDESMSLAEQADLNGALRGLHEPDIIESKRNNCRVVLETLPGAGGRIVLTHDQAQAWLASLNDVRLALGTTLGIAEDTPDRLPDDDPRAPHLDVYHWLTWMQDSLLQVLAA